MLYSSRPFKSLERQYISEAIEKYFQLANGDFKFDYIEFDFGRYAHFTIVYLNDMYQFDVEQIPHNGQAYVMTRWLVTWVMGLRTTTNLNAIDDFSPSI